MVAIFFLIKVYFMRLGLFSFVTFSISCTLCFFKANCDFKLLSKVSYCDTILS